MYNMTPFSKGELEEGEDGKDEMKEGEEEEKKEEEKKEEEEEEPEFRFTSLIFSQHREPQHQ